MCFPWQGSAAFDRMHVKPARTASRAQQMHALLLHSSMRSTEGSEVLGHQALANSACRAAGQPICAAGTCLHLRQHQHLCWPSLVPSDRQQARDRHAFAGRGLKGQAFYCVLAEPSKLQALLVCREYVLALTSYVYSAGLYALAVHHTAHKSHALVPPLPK